MDIIVNGEGLKFYKPDEVKLSITFKYGQESYEQALDFGAKEVQKFITMLKKFGFTKKDLQTSNFNIYRERVYNEQERKYIDARFMYEQASFLKFDYDMKKLSELMESISKLKNPPIYRVSFDVKDSQNVKDEVLAAAYEDAKAQAESIAKAAGLKLKKCVKVSFQPFNESFESPARYEGMSKACACESTAKTIQDIFVPQDVQVEKEIYCEWLAE